MDNATRWNSVYRMLDRAIDVEQRLEKFVKEHKPDSKAKYRPSNDRLKAKDWIYIKRLRRALEAFNIATKQTEGFRPWLSDWFITLHILMAHIDDWRVDAVEVQEDAYLAACFNASWRKLEKYYTLVDETPVYYAAILLNPTQKIQKLRELWHTHDTSIWIEPTVEKVKALWRQQYKPLHRQTTTTTYIRPNEDEDSFANRLATAKRRCITTSASTEFEDAFDAYLSTDPEPFDDEDETKSFDVLGYWIQRQHQWPGVAKMAFDVFSIPLMSDNNERSFSSGRDMVTYRRTRLKGDIIEACQCLKSWYGNSEGLFDSETAIDQDIDAVDEEI